MTMVEQAEQRLPQVAMQITPKLVSAVWSAGPGQALEAAKHLLSATLQATQNRLTSGKVSMRTFAAQTPGARQVVNLDSGRVQQQLTKELRRSGVTFSTERMPNGGVAYHIAGKDTAAVSNALEKSIQKVEARGIRNQCKRDIKQSLAQRVNAKRAPSAQRTQQLSHKPARNPAMAAKLPAAKLAGLKMGGRR